MPLLHDFYERFKYIVMLVAGIMYSFVLVGIPFLIVGIVKLAKGVVLQIALEHGFDEKDIKDYELEKIIFSETKENKIETNKKMGKLKDFFEELIKFTNGCQLFIKSLEIYQNVFKCLERFGKTNNEEWNKFKEVEI